ncbi:MAG TPA: hypothetical protein VIM73_19890 [Polyangiaceae bacterium]
MSTRFPPSNPRAARRRRIGVAIGSAAASASWMTLVAATTVGSPSLQRVRAEVTANETELSREAREEYRLVVQSYSPESVVDGVPALHARPLASAQRSVTAEELSRGVAVDVVGVGERASNGGVIIAWVERGAPNLEFDGRRARPGRDAYIGIAKTRGDGSGPQAHVVLSKRA